MRIKQECFVIVSKDEKYILAGQTQSFYFVKTTDKEHHRYPTYTTEGRVNGAIKTLHDSVFYQLGKPSRMKPNEFYVKPLKVEVVYKSK